MGRGDVSFSWLLEQREALEAHKWHVRFSQSDPHIFPRTWEAYKAIALAGRVLAARTDGDFIGLAHYLEAEDSNDWEIGGLMVSPTERRSGVGTTISYLRLGHLLFNEDPFRNGGTVITHVHEDNDSPRDLVCNKLKFKLRRSISVPGHLLPGLKTDAAGNVNGDEFEIDKVETLKVLAAWCENWTGRLKDQRRATVQLGEGITLDHWAQAFRDLARTACAPTR